MSAREECEERIRLTDEYGSSVSDFHRRLEAIKRAPLQRNDVDWHDAEASRQQAQRAWEAFERHIAEHRCLEMPPSGPPPPADSPSELLAKAAESALDVILVADDDRRFVDMNQAAMKIFGLPREEVVGRRVDEFFHEIRGEDVPQAWAGFIAEGTQCGICELKAPGQALYAYRAKANFVPGLHLGILREVERG